MVKVYSPHFHRMKGKVNYHKGRLGKVHFQMNRGNISMMITMKRELPGSEKQKEQRARFKAAALTFRDLTPQQRENLRLWGALRDDLISGYDWWTKAKLTDISIQPIIDEEEIHEVNFLNRDLNKGGADFDYWTKTTEGDGAIELAYGLDTQNLTWGREYFNYGLLGRALATLSPDKIMAVGQNGIMLVRTAGEWESVNTGTTRELWDCGAVNENLAFAIDDHATLIKYESGVCTSVRYPYAADFRSLCAISETEAIIGGGGGITYIYDGTEITKINSPCGSVIFAIWGISPSDFWAAGFTGKMCHYNGSEWDKQIDFGTDAPFMKMRGTASDNIYAICDTGQLYHYDGTDWTEIHDFAQTLRDIEILSEDEIYVLTLEGQIYRLVNGEWKLYGEQKNSWTFGMAVNGYGDIWTIGQDFTIDHARMNRHALMSGGSSATSSATLEMADYFSISIVSGATIVYGCKMKRIDENHPLPEIILMMFDMDDNYYTDSFIPQAAGDGWANYSKEITAPANLNYIKIAAQAKKRNGYADMAYVDDFFIQVSGRYLVVKCEHPLLERTMITSEDGSIVYYDSSEV